MDSSQINDFQQEPIRKVSILLGIGIFVMPYIFSWFTLREGYSKLAKIISFTWLAVLIAMPFIAPNSEDVSHYQAENKAKANSTENSALNSEQDSKISVNSDGLITIDPNVPKLEDFYDLNSRDVEHSLIYWNMINTNDANYSEEDILSVFVPEVYDAGSPFEKERIIEKFKADLPELEKKLSPYKGVKYISIPISFKQPSDEWLVYATREEYENADNVYYDAERKIFKNFCPNKFYAWGPARGRVRGANVRENHSESFDNRAMTLINKTNESDREPLCFLTIEDDAKAEDIYNALSRDKLIVNGRAYLKISSISDPKNESVRTNYQDDNGGYYYDKTNSVVVEIMAIDLNLYSTSENIKNPDLIYRKLITAPSFYK